MDEQNEKIKSLESVIKYGRFGSKPASYVNFFLGLKRPSFEVLRLSKKCAKDMEINLELFTNFLNEVIIDLQILKPLAEEAYNLNKLIKRYQTKEMSPELEALFKESLKLTLWMMSCYSIYPKRYFEIVRACCISNAETINIPTRGMIQFLLVKTLGLIMSWLIIQSHATCIIDTEKKINSVPSALTPLIDEIYNVAGKYLFQANTMVKKSCVWHKMLYQYSIKIPCSDNHLCPNWETYIHVNRVKMPSPRSPYRAQCGPFRMLTLLHQPYLYIRPDIQNYTFKMNMDFIFNSMHIFGNVDEKYDEKSYLEHVKNSIKKVEKQMTERQ